MKKPAMTTITMKKTVTPTLTISRLRALAEQLESDAAFVREIIREAEEGEISPDQAAKQLKNAGIAIA